MGEDNGVGRAAGDAWPHTERQPSEPAEGPPPDAEFDPFYKQMYPELLRYGVALCGDRQDAHDAATAAVLEVRKRWSTIENRVAYAKLVFRRQLFKLLKRNLRYVVTDPAELPEVGSADTPFAVVDEQMCVDQLLRRLPPKQQSVLRGLLDGKTYADLVADEQAKRTCPAAPDRQAPADPAMQTAVGLAEQAAVGPAAAVGLAMRAAVDPAGQASADPAAQPPADPAKQAAALRKLAELARKRLRILIRGGTEPFPPAAPAGPKETT